MPDYYSELPIDGGPILSFILLNTKDTDPLSVFCVQSSAIQQFILPTEIIRAKSKPGNSNREVFPSPIVKPTPPSSPGSNGSYRKKKDSEVSVSFAELNAGVNGEFSFESAEEEGEEDSRDKRVSFSDLSVQISETASSTSSRVAGGPVTFDDDVDVVADSSATVVPAPDILGTSGHATIVVDELEKKRRDHDSIVTDEIYLFRNLVHEIHKMGMFNIVD
jgi:hypothetical protein